MISQLILATSSPTAALKVCLYLYISFALVSKFRRTSVVRGNHLICNAVSIWPGPTPPNRCVYTRCIAINSSRASACLSARLRLQVGSVASDDDDNNDDEHVSKDSCYVFKSQLYAVGSLPSSIHSFELPSYISSFAVSYTHLTLPTKRIV